MEIKVCKLYHLYYIYFKEDYENIWWVENEDFYSQKDGFHYYNIAFLIINLDIKFNNLLKLLHNCKAVFDKGIVNIDSYFYFRSCKNASELPPTLKGRGFERSSYLIR